MKIVAKHKMSICHHYAFPDASPEKKINIKLKYLDNTTL